MTANPVDPSKVFAYVRVSTDDKGQTTENQVLDLQKTNFKIDKVFSEEISGTIRSTDRPIFKSMLEEAKEGDTILCTKVSRLARNTRDILDLVDLLKERKIHLIIIELQSVDLTSAMGNFFLKLTASVAELERDIISDNVCAGLRRTKANGTVLGPPLVIPPDVLKSMLDDWNNGASYNQITRKWRHRYAKSSIQRLVNKWDGKIEEYQQEYSIREKQYRKSKTNNGKRKGKTND